MAVMQKVTATIMKRTNNMTEFNPDDKYVIDLAERQMKAMSEIRSTIYDSDKKGEWSGWKVRVKGSGLDGRFVWTIRPGTAVAWNTSRSDGSSLTRKARRS